MRPITITRALAAPAVAAICASQTVGIPGNPLLINGSLASGGVARMAAQQLIGITSVGDIHTVVFTVTGTDDQGRVISETITGVNTNTVNSVLNYRTVTSIIASAIVASAITVDTVGIGASQEIPVDIYVNQFNVILATEITGAVNYTVQYTMDNVFGGVGPFIWNSVAGLQTQTTNQVVQVTQLARAFRVLTNSGQGTVALIVTQGGLAGI
jgi:hypothetical protein